MVETQNGEWYLTFLTGRPLTERGRCITGRETGIEKVEWRDDDWLYLACGGQAARQFVEAPDLPEHKFPAEASRLTFDTPELDINFQALRVPMTEDWVNQTDREGYLRLYGRESLTSCFHQSMVARRVQAHHTVSTTCVEFNPACYQQMAGMACYYNTYHFHYLHVFGGDEDNRKFLGLMSCDKLEAGEVCEPVEITGSDKVWMKADFNGAELQFFYSLTGEDNWQKFGPVLDGSILSDEYVENPPGPFRPCFTGAFIGLACQDLSGRRFHADFDFFEYVEK